MICAQSWLPSEPTVTELLDDPMVRALMKSDHVDLEDLANGIRHAQATLRWRNPAAGASTPRVEHQTRSGRS